MVQRRWVHAAPLADLPAHGGRSLRIEGRWYALFRAEDGTVLAIDDACPHEGTPLGDGAFHAGRVICGSHDWVFDARSGACLNVPGVRVACYATRLVGDAVEIAIDA
jgi:nitrite reductase/ring-hydroxylating ferredoxin subunit